MSEDETARWSYRLDSYRRALSHLAGAVGAERDRGLSDLERMGLTQAFEIVVELGWKLLKDVLGAQGQAVSSFGPNAIIRAAFEGEIVANGRGWLRAIDLRNSLSHTYKQEMFLAAVPEIAGDHFVTLSALPGELERLGFL